MGDDTVSAAAVALQRSPQPDCTHAIDESILQVPAEHVERLILRIYICADFRVPHDRASLRGLVDKWRLRQSSAMHFWIFKIVEVSIWVALAGDPCRNQCIDRGFESHRRCEEVTTLRAFFSPL